MFPHTWGHLSDRTTDLMAWTLIYWQVQPLRLSRKIILCLCLWGHTSTLVISAIAMHIRAMVVCLRYQFVICSLTSLLVKVTVLLVLHLAIDPGGWRV